MKVNVLMSLPFLKQKINLPLSGELVHFRVLQITKVFDNELMFNYGNLFVNDPYNHDYWIHRELEIPLGVNNQDFISQSLIHLLYELNPYLNCLWIAVNHNVSTRCQFGYIKGIPLSYTSNNSSLDFSYDGSLKDYAFSSEDVSLANKIYKNYFDKNKNHLLSESDMKLLSMKGSERIRKGAISGLISKIHYDEYTRVERAMMFLGDARTVEFLPKRIAMFMPIFECLFATESEGVSFKIPFRVAHYIENDRDKKKEVFESLSIAYDIRSRYFHGDQINKGSTPKSKSYKTMEDLIPISKNVEDITRRVLNKVINEDLDCFIDTSKKFKDFLDKLTFV